MAPHNQIGIIGEDLAAIWLEREGYSIIERNYNRKWGEIDIIANKSNLLHFIEVKTVSYETRAQLEYSVSHETWSPEEKVHSNKLYRLSRAIQSWLAEKNVQTEFQIDVVTVRVVPREKYSQVKMIENVILEVPRGT